MKHRASLICNFALVAVSALVCSAADPQQPLSKNPVSSLALSPAVISVKAQPGVSSTHSLTLTNLTSNDLHFVLEALDVVVQDGKRVFVPAGETEGGIARSAVFNPNELELKSGQSGHANVTLTLPADPKVRAVVAVFHGQTPLQGPGMVMFTGSLGALITFNLSERVNLRAGAPTISPQTETANLTIHQELQNEGAEPVIPKGTLAILKSSGELVGRIAIEAHRLLPGEKFDCAIEYPHTLRQGEYRGLVSFEYAGGVQTSSIEFQVVE